MNKSKAALSHAIAYAYEELNKCGNRTAAEAACKTTTLKGLVKLTERAWDVDVAGFYRAMVNVVPHLEFPEHGGTECRGWYRVWADITLDTGYFSKFDMGRDASMALDFFEHGAITKEQHDTYRVKTTLRMAVNTMTNGRPDVAKIIGPVKHEYRAKIFDLDILSALDIANGDPVGRI